ncbi:hypothetical protein PGT21_023184 [Puccinia graminis f. sp. tritici]|uniref:Uncharacterized protein n=1 Tax=Puccinia graminis f. sp. tritici TaxID=56615 RepID=A0A5B0PAU1_PUCGR|nr:hypothetical protein PGT21_023184 [Puccinia graminis f. sp. tritici]
MIDKDALVYNIDFFLRAELTTQRSKTSHTFDTRMPDRRTDARRIRKPPFSRDLNSMKLVPFHPETRFKPLASSRRLPCGLGKERDAHGKFQPGQMTVNQRLGTSD